MINVQSHCYIRCHIYVMNRRCVLFDRFSESSVYIKCRCQYTVCYSDNKDDHVIIYSHHSIILYTSDIEYLKESSL